MKVFLIYPNPNQDLFSSNLPEPPLGLAWIAKYLENFCDVKIVDNYLEKKNLAELIYDIENFAPDAVGISVTSFTYENSKELAKAIKAINKGINIFIGGPHVTLLTREALKETYFDAGIVGEGEITTREYLLALEKKGDLSRIKGLIFKDNKGEIHVNPARELIEDIDQLPFPSRELLKINDYPEFIKSGVFSPSSGTNMNTSRGCPYRCNFCSTPAISGKKWRAMTAERIVKEIEYLVREYEVKFIHFNEDHFTLSRERVLKFCNELVKSGINISWRCTSRVDNVDEELLEAMVKSGCQTIWFGIESYSQTTLNFYRKDIKSENIKNAVALCKKEGILPVGGFILGAPDETVEDMKRTIDFALSLNLDETYFNILLAYSGSELYNYVKENRLIANYLTGDIAEIKGTVSRKRIQQLLQMAIRKTAKKQFINHWKEYLIYYLKHPNKFGFEKIKPFLKIFIPGI